MNGFYVQARVSLVDPGKMQDIESSGARQALTSGSTADMAICVESDSELLARRLALNYAYQNGVIVTRFLGVVKSIGKSGKAYVFMNNGKMTRYEPKPFQQETWHDGLDEG